MVMDLAFTACVKIVIMALPSASAMKAGTDLNAISLVSALQSTHCLGLVLLFSSTVV